MKQIQRMKQCSNEKAFHNRRIAAKLAIRLSTTLDPGFINVHKYVDAIRSSERFLFQLKVFQ